MSVDGAPDEVPPVINEFARLLAAVGYDGPIGALERFAFYERTRAAYSIVSTGERRYWGNLILKKGAIPPEPPAA
jgi:L-fucose mutarotase